MHFTFNLWTLMTENQKSFAYLGVDMTQGDLLIKSLKLVLNL